MEGFQTISSISWLLSQGRWFSSKAVMTLVLTHFLHLCRDLLQEYSIHAFPHRVKIGWAACSSLCCTFNLSWRQVQHLTLSRKWGSSQSPWPLKDHTFVQTRTSSQQPWMQLVLSHWLAWVKYSLMLSLSLDGAQCPSGTLPLEQRPLKPH